VIRGNQNQAQKKIPSSQRKTLDRDLKTGKKKYTTRTRSKITIKLAI
jgi:hypothetical protein